MKTFWRKFLDVLKRIEPLFRLVEVFLIAIATVIVAINANSIAKQANQIAEMQLYVNKEEIQPDFVISQTLEESRKGVENGNSILYISNIGGHYTNIEINCICEINLSYFENDVDVTSYSFGVYDFYLFKVWSGSAEGLICKMFCEGNWENFRIFYFDVLNDHHIDDAIVDLIHYIKITYNDILGENHTKYYSFNGIQQQLLSKDTGEEAFEEFDKKLDKLSIDELSLEEIIKRLPNFSVSINQ